MEKLIALLNEYERSSYEKDTNWVYEWDEWEYYEPNNRIIKGNWENEEVLTQYELCSKQFWFIKWLVDNDKIDLDKVEQEAMSWFDDESPVYWKDIRTARLIMMLSVDDRPIEFLISILKDKKVRTVYVDEDWNVSWDTKRYSDC